jgi:DNA processing protein
VFAIPGSIFSQGAQGTNQLIKDGAKLVTEATDILEELNLNLATVQAEVQQLIPGSDTEARLLSHLSGEPTHIDELRRQSQLPVATVSSTLAIMEIKGLVKQVGGMNYIVSREVAPAYRT